MKGGWACVGVLLLLHYAAVARAAVAYISNSGQCLDEAPPPPGVTCMTFRAALMNSSITSMVLVEDVTLQRSDWVYYSGLCTANCSTSRDDSSDQLAPDAYTLDRDLSITALNIAMALDFNFITSATVIGVNRTLTLRDMAVENVRRGAGLAMDFFVGATNSTIEIDNVVRWRYVCTAAAEAVKVHRQYPRPPSMPGAQRVSNIDDYCWRGHCFGADGTVHYDDFAMVVVPAMTDTSSYMPGYTIVLHNTTRVCQTLVPDSCLKVMARDLCLMQYTDAYAASLQGEPDNTPLIAGVASGAVSALVITAVGVGVLLVRRRRKRLRKKQHDEENGNVFMRFGPLEDMVKSDKKHGWKVTHHASARPGETALSDRIELGALLGAGSFGRVYAGTWQGKDVAVKVMQHDARTASKVANEVELMMMMDHPNILKAFDVITWTLCSGSSTAKRPASTSSTDQQGRKSSSTGSQAGTQQTAQQPARSATTGAAVASTSTSSAAPAPKHPVVDSAMESSRSPVPTAPATSSTTVAAASASGSGATAAAAAPSKKQQPQPPQQQQLGAQRGAQRAQSGGGHHASGSSNPSPQTSSFQLMFIPEITSTVSFSEGEAAGGAAAEAAAAAAAATATAGVAAGAAPAVPQSPPAAVAALRTSSGESFGAAAGQTTTSGIAVGSGVGTSSLTGTATAPGTGMGLVISGSTRHSSSGGTGSLGPSVTTSSGGRGSGGRGRRAGRSSGGSSSEAGRDTSRPISYLALKGLAGSEVAPYIEEEEEGGQAAGGQRARTGSGAHSSPGASGGFNAEQGAAGAGMPGFGGGDPHDDSGDGSPSEEAQTWLIVEFCDGGTLADAVRSGKLGPRSQPDLTRVLMFLRDIASGLAYLHGRNVLHGDLKAANVLLCSCPNTPYGQVAKVADFGLSRMLKVGQTHRSTRTVGTVTHMPPELLRLGKLSPAGDVYAFGIIMWEVFTGCTAFQGQHYGEVFERVALRDERPPVLPNMPPGFASLMSSCWQAEPTARPGFDIVLRQINAMLEDMQQRPGDDDQDPTPRDVGQGGIPGGYPGVGALLGSIGARASGGGTISGGIVSASGMALGQGQGQGGGVEGRPSVQFDPSTSWGAGEHFEDL